MTNTDARILIIDDNVNLARGFATALGRAGYDVCLAHTAEEGLRLAAERSPHAILLDFRMPFVNGVGFLYRLRQVPTLRDVPVMVITGASVDDETLADLRDLHASLRFKPLALPDLLEETRTLVATQHPSPLPPVLKAGWRERESSSLT
jgi:DNA-binding response OmpR family regulator